jgi:hypothetical protein
LTNRPPKLLKMLWYILVCCFAYKNANAQQPVPYEQIAFNYYNEHLKNTDTKGTLWLDLIDYTSFKHWYPRCLGSFQILENNLIYSNVSKLEKLKELPGFTIKPMHKGSFPHVFATTSFSILASRHVVNVVEEYRYYGSVFHIEMDENGNVINSCKSGWINN